VAAIMFIFTKYTQVGQRKQWKYVLHIFNLTSGNGVVKEDFNM